MSDLIVLVLVRFVDVVCSKEFVGDPVHLVASIHLTIKFCSIDGGMATERLMEQINIDECAYAHSSMLSICTVNTSNNLS